MNKFNRHQNFIVIITHFFRSIYENRNLQIKNTDIEISNEDKKLKNIYLYQKDKISQIQLYG